MLASFSQGIRVDLPPLKNHKKTISRIATCLLLTPISAFAQPPEIVVQDLDKSFVAVPIDSEEATRFVKKPAAPVVTRSTPTLPNSRNSKKFTGTALPIRISEPTTTNPSTQTDEK